MTNSAQIKEQLRQSLAYGESGAQSAASGDTTQPPAITSPGNAAPSASSIGSAVTFRMAKMQYDMLQQADNADREAGGRASIDALLAIVRAEAQLPGRKVVVYFNPWLNIPDIAKEQYGYMISAANRANVTFYTGRSQVGG